MDQLDFVMASGQEDKGDQEGDGKRGKGQKGNTPTAAGQEGKGRRGETLTALGQEDKKGGEVIPMMENEEEREGAVGKGKKRKTIELENQRLQTENKSLLQRLRKSEEENEKNAAAYKEPPLHQAILNKDDREAMLLLNTDSDVNSKNFSGMTPLHCAARLCNVGLVDLLLKMGADANAITYKTRTPGGYSALALLAENSHREMQWEDVQKTAALLVDHMNMETFAAQTSKGRTTWHLLSTRGNHQLLGWLLDHFEFNYGRENLKIQLNMLTSDDGKGKSVKDDAMGVNGTCRDLVAAKGGINVHPMVKNPGEKILPGHHWHRQTWRDYWGR